MKGKGIIERTTRTIVAMLIVAAVAAPVAQADAWQLEHPSQISDWSDRHGSSGTQISDALDRYVADNPQSTPDAVDRYLASRPRPISDALDRFVANDPQSTPDAVDRYVAKTSQSIGAPDRFVISDHSDRSDGVRFAAGAPASDGSGLEWDAFAFGFGLGIAMCVLGGVALLSLRRRRTVVHA